MKRMLICLSAGLASGCGGSQESASAPPKEESKPTPAVTTVENKTETAEPAPAKPAATLTSAPAVSAAKKEVEPPGLVLPDDDIGSKAPELPPIR